MFIWEGMWLYFSCVCLSDYEFFYSLKYEYFTSICFTHFWSSTSTIVLYFSLNICPLNYLQDFSSPKLIPLDQVLSFPHQEEIPSISSSFYLIFNLSFIMGFFTKARNKVSNSALQCSKMCARAPWHLRASTLACMSILAFSGKTHQFGGLKGSWSVLVSVYVSKYFILLYYRRRGYIYLFYVLICHLWSNFILTAIIIPLLKLSLPPVISNFQIKCLLFYWSTTVIVTQCLSDNYQLIGYWRNLEYSMKCWHI